MTRPFPDLPPYSDKGHTSGPNQDPPYPGTDEAIANDCLCCAIDNQGGYGSVFGKGLFIIRGDCPLHGLAVRDIQMELR